MAAETHEDHHDSAHQMMPGPAFELHVLKPRDRLALARGDPSPPVTTSRPTLTSPPDGGLVRSQHVSPWCRIAPLGARRRRLVRGSARAVRSSRVTRWRDSLATLNPERAFKDLENDITGWLAAYEEEVALSSPLSGEQYVPWREWPGRKRPPDWTEADERERRDEPAPKRPKTTPALRLRPTSLQRLPAPSRRHRPGRVSPLRRGQWGRSRSFTRPTSSRSRNG